MRDIVVQIFATAKKLAGNDQIDKLCVVKAYEETLRLNGMKPVDDIVIYEHVLDIFD